MLQKGVYPCEYIDDKEKFNDMQLSGNKDFYCNLNK